MTRQNVSVELVPRPKRLDAVVGVTSEPLQSPMTGEEVIDHLVGPTAVQLALGADSFTAKNFQFHFEMEAKLVIVSTVGGGKDETADRADLPPTLTQPFWLDFGSQYVTDDVIRPHISSTRFPRFVRK